MFVKKEKTYLRIICIYRDITYRKQHRLAHLRFTRLLINTSPCGIIEEFIQYTYNIFVLKNFTHFGASAYVLVNIFAIKWTVMIDSSDESVK